LEIPNQKLMVFPVIWTYCRVDGEYCPNFWNTVRFGWFTVQTDQNTVQTQDLDVFSGKRDFALSWAWALRGGWFERGKLDILSGLSWILSDSTQILSDSTRLLSKSH